MTGIEITGHAQREAWTERTLPPVEQVAPDLWSIPVPIPHSPLRYVSVYVLAAAGGVVLIDAGWDDAAAWHALQQGLGDVGVTLGDVRGVLVTHMHFDHLGLAGKVREASGAWVALHTADQEVLRRFDFRDAERARALDVAFLQTLGASEAAAAEAVGPAEQFLLFADVARPDRSLRHGELADVPGWSLRALHTPGHTPGHLCFLDERGGRLFSGDHVLPRISPNISADRSGVADPLGSYLESLRLVRDLEVTDVFPAHEWRFRGLDLRVDELLDHHEVRLAELLAAILSHPRSTPWDLAEHLTWSRPWESYGGRMKIFAVTETAAHVFRLVAAGLVTVLEGSVPRYLATA